MWQELCSDEGGAVLSTELILLLVTTVIGTTVGLVSLRDAMNAQKADVSGAMAAVDPSFRVDGVIFVSPHIASSGPQSTFVAGWSYAAATGGKAGDTSFAPAATLIALPPGDTAP